jgi:hypothetical protein
MAGAFAVADAAAAPVLEDALRRLVNDQLGALGPLVEPSVFGELRGALRHVASHASAEKLREATEPWLRIESANAARAWLPANVAGAAAFLLIEKGSGAGSCRRGRALARSMARRANAASA